MTETSKTQVAAEPPINVSKADLAGMYLDGYQAGAEYALRLYAYSSGQAWAESGVKYVGSTGKTLVSAVADMHDHVWAMRVAEGVPVPE